MNSTLQNRLKARLRNSHFAGTLRAAKRKVKLAAHPVLQMHKRRFFQRIQACHNKRIAGGKFGTPLRVVFIVIHSSVWKVDPVFAAMLEDPDFDPVIVIVPNCTAATSDQMVQEMAKAQRMFDAKGYATLLADIRQGADSTNAVVSLNPDVVFFTNPHPITDARYYTELFDKYLTCYVPYHHEVASYDNGQAQYNQYFHNAMWKIFVPHQTSLDAYIKYRAGKDIGVQVTGYPACEVFRGSNVSQGSVWKPQPASKTRIIWAPHHSIDYPGFSLGNFLDVAEIFRTLAVDLQDDVQWAFKPHPMLMQNLYQHKDWGVQKTDAYFAFWDTQPNTQLENGAYDQLFVQSDALIHDSSSFLAEYMYVDKPVMFMNKTQHPEVFFNGFGHKALSVSEYGNARDDILGFIQRVQSGADVLADGRAVFIATHLGAAGAVKPSAHIVNSLKETLLG